MSTLQGVSASTKHIIGTLNIHNLTKDIISMMVFIRIASMLRDLINMYPDINVLNMMIIHH